MMTAKVQLASHAVGTDGCVDARKWQRQRARRAIPRAGGAPTTPS